MSLLAFQNHMWPAGGGGSAPAVVGYNGLNIAGTPDTASGTSVLVPFHASASVGNCGVAIVEGKDGTPTITPPSGWVSVGMVEAFTGSTWGEVFVKDSLESGEVSAGGATFTFGGTTVFTGASCVLDAGSLGANDSYTSGTVVGSIAAPSISVDAGGTVVYVVLLGGRNLVPSSPTPDYSHAPDDSSSARSCAFYVSEDVAGPNSPALTVNSSATALAIWSIEIESA